MTDDLERDPDLEERYDLDVTPGERFGHHNVKIRRHRAPIHAPGVAWHRLVVYAVSLLLLTGLVMCAIGISRGIAAATANGAAEARNLGGDVFAVAIIIVVVFYVFRWLTGR